MDRLKKIKSIRKNLSKGGNSIGSWIQIPHTSIAEIMGQAGYDWVGVDMEHGTISPHQLPDLFRALELGNTLPLVRLAQGEAKDCKQALDAGAEKTGNDAFIEQYKLVNEFYFTQRKQVLENICREE